MIARRTPALLVFAVASGLISSIALAAQPSTCGQHFDDAVAPLPVATSGGVTIEPVGCSSRMESPRHCLGVEPAGAVSLDIVRPAFEPPLRAYQLWLRVATSTGSGKMTFGLNSEPAVAWWVPPTAGSGWQLVTLPDRKTPQPFLLRAGVNRLHLGLPRSAGGTAVTVDCLLLAADPDFVPDVKARHRLDQVWSGVGVLFDALQSDRFLYVGYYNAERYLTVAAYDRKTRVWQRRALDSRFGGWDNHNAIALALDHAGNLHIAGNMHASPLVYGRTREPGRLDAMQLLNRMVGSEETQTTYPTWIDLPDGGLGFLYREGVSGAGRDIVDSYDGAKWSRRGDAPLFSVPAGSVQASAYPTVPLLGPDGYLHIAWVWRRTADAATSFQVGYARSRDMLHWQAADGTALSLPIGPGQGDIIDNVPERAGLSNQVTLGFDAAGRPVVSYLKFDAAGNTQLFDARPAGTGWQVVQVSDWHDRWELQGYGTIQALIRQGAVAVDRGLLVQTVRHWKAGWFDYVLNPASLRPSATRPAERLLPTALMQSSASGSDFAPIVIAARQPGDKAAPAKFVLRWEVQAGNRDQRPACTVERPLACKPPPSQLVVFERP